MTITDRLDEINVNRFEDGDGAEAVARCFVDGYPTGLDCTCGHGHDRHSGQDDNTRCMSYIYQPDCDCKAFIPSPGSVAGLWEDAKAMHAALRKVLYLLDEIRSNDTGSDFRAGGIAAAGIIEHAATAALGEA